MEENGWEYKHPCPQQCRTVDGGLHMLLIFSIQSAALLLQMEGHSEEQLLEQTELQCLGASVV